MSGVGGRDGRQERVSGVGVQDSGVGTGDGRRVRVSGVGCQESGVGTGDEVAAAERELDRSRALTFGLIRTAR